jgi:hypothetical protein
MTDQNAYINAYVDNSVGMLHEYVTMVLQLKTQLKVTSDMVAEKETTISSLNEEVERIKGELNSYKSKIGDNNQLINQSKVDAIKWEKEYNEMKNKVSLVDNLTSQMNEMKKIILEKDKEIVLLNNKLSPKPSPKKIINTKDKREEPIVMKESEPDKNDDF